MNPRTISIPETALVDILKSLPDKMLADIFWKAFVRTEEFPLSDSEKKELAKAKNEFANGQTVKWENIR